MECAEDRREGSSGTGRVTPPHTLIPVPEPPFHCSLLDPLPSQPAVLIGMEGRGGILGGGGASRGFAGRGCGRGALMGVCGGEPGGCLATPQLSVDLEEAALS